LYQYDLWYMSLYVGDRVVSRYTCIPHGHLHTVTYTRGRIDTVVFDYIQFSKFHTHTTGITHFLDRGFYEIIWKDML